ncbi:MAG: D-glycero-beta-D-manno-heptose-7-phosphate kinase [Syntrophales bacterium]|jgi:D-beta-D-heptose 7-phosphate kinase/D-beta-D-heptose 1-phosphate adenosyltransferase
MMKSGSKAHMMSKKRAFEIIDRFPDAAVMVVGDIMLDHFIWGKVSRISPEAPVPVVEVSEDRLLLGGSANVSNNILAATGRVYVSGVIGADDMGRRIVTEFNDRQADTKGLIVESGRPTTLKTRILAHGQQVVRFDREIRRTIEPDSTNRILSYFNEIRDRIGAVVISDYRKGVVTRALLDGIRKAVSGRRITVCVDPKQSDFSLYQGFDIITPNHLEAGLAADIEIQNGRDVIRAGTVLLERYDFKALLITRGEQGMSLFERDGGIRHTHLPTQAKEVYDVTGAGDTAIGIFALAMASGSTFQEAAVLANHAAGIVVGKAGTSTVSRDELKRAL